MIVPIDQEDADRCAFERPHRRETREPAPDHDHAWATIFRSWHQLSLRTARHLPAIAETPVEVNRSAGFNPPPACGSRWDHHFDFAEVFRAEFPSNACG